MIYSISNNLLLPPEFIWFQIESDNDKDNKKDLFSSKGESASK